MWGSSSCFEFLLTITKCPHHRLSVWIWRLRSCFDRSLTMTPDHIRQQRAHPTLCQQHPLRHQRRQGRPRVGTNPRVLLANPIELCNRKRAICSRRGENPSWHRPHHQYEAANCQVPFYWMQRSKLFVKTEDWDKSKLQLERYIQNWEERNVTRPVYGLVCIGIKVRFYIMPPKQKVFQDFKSNSAALSLQQDVRAIDEILRDIRELLALTYH